MSVRLRIRAEVAINRSVLLEKGGGKDRENFIPMARGELLMGVASRGGLRRRLIPRGLENTEEAEYTCV